MRLYKLLAKPPLLVLASIGGWSVKRTVVAYLSILVAVFMPSFRTDAIAVLGLDMLFTYGRRYYVDSMVRLHIVRRLRADPEKLVEIEAEPALALLYFLKGSSGTRSLMKYKGLAEKVSFLKAAIYYPSVSCLVVFVGCVFAITASIWAPMLRVWDGTMVQLADIGAYGIVIGLIALLVANFVGTIFLESEKPVFVEEGELKALGGPGKNAQSSSD